MRHFGIPLVMQTRTEKDPCRCVVLEGALQGKVPFNKALELFGVKVPVKCYYNTYTVHT